MGNNHTPYHDETRSFNHWTVQGLLQILNGNNYVNCDSLSSVQRADSVDQQMRTPGDPSWSKNCQKEYRYKCEQQTPYAIIIVWKRRWGLRYKYQELTGEEGDEYGYTSRAHMMKIRRRYQP